MSLRILPAALELVLGNVGKRPFGSPEQHFGLSKHERPGWLGKWKETVMTKPAILLPCALSHAAFGPAVGNCAERAPDARIGTIARGRQRAVDKIRLRASVRGC
jgi:hypothetical protein